MRERRQLKTWRALEGIRDTGDQEARVLRHRREGVGGGDKAMARGGEARVAVIGKLVPTKHL